MCNGGESNGFHMLLFIRVIPYEVDGAFFTDRMPQRCANLQQPPMPSAKSSHAE